MKIYKRTYFFKVDRTNQKRKTIGKINTKGFKEINRK